MSEEIKKGEGLRFNEGKLRYDLVHPWAHEQMVRVLTKGAIKYAERNWEKGMAWSKVLSSLERHLAAIKAGEDYDVETGELHAAHLACNAHFLTAYYRIYPQGDDRPQPYLQHPKIALDIDEVICSFTQGWKEHFSLERLPESWFFDRNIVEKFAKMKEEGVLDEFYLGLKPLISPSDIPFEPHCYVTSRPVTKEITEKWLDMHNFPAVPVYTIGLGESKAEVIKKSGAEVFVDDRFDNFEELNNKGICTFLYDAPHNRRYNVGYKRIHSLKELLAR